MLTTNICGENLLHAALQEVGIIQYLTKARNYQQGNNLKPNWQLLLLIYFRWKIRWFDIEKLSRKKPIRKTLFWEGCCTNIWVDFIFDYFHRKQFRYLVKEILWNTQRNIFTIIIFTYITENSKHMDRSMCIYAYIL